MLSWLTDFLKWEGAAILGICLLLWALGVFQI